MLRMSTKTSLSPEEAVKRAVAFFGGHGLKITEQNAACAYFEGAGGGVEVSACTEGEGTMLDMVSREWDSLVREFASTIPH